MRLENYQIHISLVCHVRAAYRVTKAMLTAGGSLIALLAFFGSMFYLLGFCIQSLQTADHTWLDKTVRSSANIAQISQYGQFPTWEPEKNFTVQTRGVSPKRLSEMLSLACSGQALLSGIPIIGIPVGFTLGLWNGYQAP